MRQLGIFAKHWRPGQTKTRLAESIGSELAAELALAMLEVSLARFAGLADRHVLAYSPPEAHREFESIAGPNWNLEPQSAGDLGQRMRAYFESALGAGAARVILLGSDSPTLPLARIQEAFVALESKDIVLGPSDDGGYYLIGGRIVPPVFEGIPWSTPEVWRLTVAALERAGATFHALPAWHDVDEFPDLARLRDELRDPSAPAERRLLECVERAIAARADSAPLRARRATE